MFKKSSKNSARWSETKLQAIFKIWQEFDVNVHFILISRDYFEDTNMNTGAGSGSDSDSDTNTDTDIDTEKDMGHWQDRERDTDTDTDADTNTDTDTDTKLTPTGMLIGKGH